METTWPGTWLIVAYLLFVSVGVLGSLAWSVVFYLEPRLNGKSGGGRFGMIHMILFEIGLLGATGMMSAIGFVGGNFVAHGGSAAVSSELIRTGIIPPLSNDPNSVLFNMPPVIEAVFIGLAALAQLVGLFTLLTLKKEGTPSSS